MSEEFERPKHWIPYTPKDFEQWKKEQKEKEMEAARQPLPLNDWDKTFLHLFGISSE